MIKSWILPKSQDGKLEKYDICIKLKITGKLIHEVEWNRVFSSSTLWHVD